MYRALRPLLFRLDPERAHALTLATLQLAYRAGLLTAGPHAQSDAVQLMGLRFANRVGLAAGFDKNGVCIDALGALGFGFIEVGTVTPLPQNGNPRPRVFRLPRERAVINRMGFPNDGVQALRERLRRRRYRGICGVNIGKNAQTPLDRAAEDYVKCLRAVYEEADYVTINVSSPNTQDLRLLQESARLQPVLERLLEERLILERRTGRRVPLLVKLSPDLSPEALEQTAGVLKSLAVDGVIATNSTTRRDILLGRDPAARQPGGLSGAPLHPLSVTTIRELRALLGPAVPIIGVGGIHSIETARRTFAAGADLIQTYTGLIYEGPRLVGQLIGAAGAAGAYPP